MAEAAEPPPPPLLAEGSFDADLEPPPAATSAAWLARVREALRGHFPALSDAQLQDALYSNEAAVINVHDILRGDANVALGVSIHALPALLSRLGIARTDVLVRPISWPPSEDHFEMFPPGDLAAPWLCMTSNVRHVAYHLILVHGLPGLVFLPSTLRELDEEWEALAVRVGKSWSPYDGAYWDGDEAVAMPHAARFARGEVLRWVVGWGHEEDEHGPWPAAAALVKPAESLAYDEDQTKVGSMLECTFAVPYLVDIWTGAKKGTPLRAKHARGFLGGAMHNAISELKRCARRGGAAGLAARRCLKLHNGSSEGFDDYGLDSDVARPYKEHAVPETGDESSCEEDDSEEGEEAGEDGEEDDEDGDDDDDGADDGAADDDDDGDVSASAPDSVPAPAPRKRAPPVSAPAPAPRKRAAPAPASVPAPASRKRAAPAPAPLRRSKRGV